MGSSCSSSSSAAQEDAVREVQPATVAALARMGAELLQGLLSSPAAGQGSAFLSPLGAACQKADSTTKTSLLLTFRHGEFLF
mmetsp:Transcript_73548/g.215763  ORF Transcript_73548/g.215763 Transcript_73548/m.215763 type:complete len:82 (-) Transcript_73548:145-390(-)